MSLRKRCSPKAPIALRDGTPNPFHCPKSPRCEHVWHYDFRVNRQRYRASTETDDKQKAKDIESKERSRILEGRHGIRRQPDITFKAFAELYLRDHADVNKRSAARDRALIAKLNRTFGGLILHEITPHRIEQWKRERLSETWKANGQTGPAKKIQPGTVNRELDGLRGILSKAVEWGKLADSPMRRVKRLKVDNRRTRILSEDEQRRLLDACPGKVRAIVLLALITGARIGELLALTWEHTTDGALTFMETKNGKMRRVLIGPSIQAVLDHLPKQSPWLFTNVRTQDRFTVNGVRHVFDRAVVRADIVPADDVTLHTLRHTALSRMVDSGHDDHTVMSISGHSSARMLARYTHPTDQRKISALESFGAVTNGAQTDAAADEDRGVSASIAQLLAGKLVDAGRIELPASALRTNRMKRAK